VIIENAFTQNMHTKSAPLKISICSENDMLIIRHNIQRKIMTTDADFEAGLDNLVRRYKLLSGQPLVIRDLKNERVIELPLLEKELEVVI